jgi:hypothetical protein
MVSGTTSIEPYAGFKLDADTVVVSAAHQRAKLAVLGVDATAFGHCVDPSFFIGMAIHAGVNSGISSEGAINMVQSLIVHRCALLDEELSVNGEIKSISEVPRGRSTDTDVWFNDENGEPVITARCTSLRPNPDQAPGRGAGARAAPIIEDLELLAMGATHELSPECVKAYSSEGNSIHYDLAAAQKAGFRAPLIGGGMGVHFLLADLWRRRAPQALSCDIYFRRPIFWDDAVTIGILGDNRAQALVKRDSHGALKVATEIAIHELISAP